MTSCLHFSKLWSDEHVIRLQIRVTDVDSRFTNAVYVAPHELPETAHLLDEFKTELGAGALDLQFGVFGSEDPNGAFRARFQFSERGRLLIACEQESDHVPFAGETVARRATLYLKSEPALLDRFVAELHALASGESDEAFLEAV